MKIKALSRYEVEKFESRERWICISITDPNSDPVKFKQQPFALLLFQFSDIDRERPYRDNCPLCKGSGKSRLFKDKNDQYHDCDFCTNNPNEVLMTDEDADKVLDFLYRNETQTNLLIVHCEAGVSRSVGVASALSLICNGSDEEYFKMHRPNMHVYRKILNAYMKDR